MRRRCQCGVGAPPRPTRLPICAPVRAVDMTRPPRLAVNGNDRAGREDAPDRSLRAAVAAIDAPVRLFKVVAELHSRGRARARAGRIGGLERRARNRCASDIHVRGHAPRHVNRTDDDISDEWAASRGRARRQTTRAAAQRAKVVAPPAPFGKLRWPRRHRPMPPGHATAAETAATREREWRIACRYFAHDRSYFSTRRRYASGRPESRGVPDVADGPRSDRGGLLARSTRRHLHFQPSTWRSPASTIGAWRRATGLKPRSRERGSRAGLG